MPAPNDHGALPPWTQADLPEPRPFSLVNSLKTIGPGAILLAAAIGGGEWIVGPMMVVSYGPSILWIATAAILLQSLFNLEGIRYTLYTGEPILTGVMRLSPGPAMWATVYGLLAVTQLATPALAKGCAAVLFAAYQHRLPEEGDESTASYGEENLDAGVPLTLAKATTVGNALTRNRAAKAACSSPSTATTLSRPAPSSAIS